MASPCRFLELPSELVQSVLSYLDVTDLANVAQTCRSLGFHSYDDQIWLPIINSHLPRPISTPGPCKTFRELYLAHHPHWFLLKKRIWFGDSEPNGKLLIAQFNEAQGSIEAHTVLATRGEHNLSLWQKDREVIIHSFDPTVLLDRHQPVLRLHARDSSIEQSAELDSHDQSSDGISRYSRETLMDTFENEGLYSSFILTRNLPTAAIFDRTLVWPPLQFPSHGRTRNDTQDRFTSSGHRPARLFEVSQDTFRIRRWVEYAGRGSHPSNINTNHPTRAPYATTSGLLTFASALRAAGGPRMTFRLPEFITTFATLPESSYTPTASKPWQGIWCGDYSGHGCEFLLITQPDRGTQRPLPSGMDRLRGWFAAGVGRRDRRESDDGSEGSFVSAVESLDRDESNERAAVAADVEEMLSDEEDEIEDEAHVLPEMFAPDLPLPGHFSNIPVPSSHAQDFDDVPSGRIEAVKLTGDPNIPRGEYTFIAPEIGHGGFLRIADEEPFCGARVVRSAGHIAGRGFVQDQYTPSQLIIISHDRLAQLWEGFGHISYYQRVDLDALDKRP